MLEPCFGPVEFGPGLGGIALRLFQVLDRPGAGFIEAAYALQGLLGVLQRVAGLVVIGISLRQVARLDYGNCWPFRDMISQPD